MGRKFEVIGEAIGKLAKLDPEVAARISEYRRMITFRNILIHDYADVDDRLVWEVVSTKLSTLQQEIASLLQES